MAKVVIVTSGQPSANPRVIKEATALNNAGFSVTVIYAPLSLWADKFDAELFTQTSSITWIRAGYHPLKQPLLYKLIRARRKFYELIDKYVPFLNRNCEYALVLYAQELKKQSVCIKADIYIGHNLGALPAVVHASKRWKARCGFDAEDYHRGESSINSSQYKYAVNIENKYIPRLSYLSTASPLITEAYRKLYSLTEIFTINNVFSRDFLQTIPLESKGGLSLFWFSQTAGKNRGLEVVVMALNKLSKLNISLNILGECSMLYKQELMRLSVRPSSINFISPKPLKDIFKMASQYDIGLASEIPYCENRDICLTNKLFTYLLSGNALLASDTKAQTRFVNKYQDIGLLYEHNDATDLSKKIEQLYDNKQLVLKFRQKALKVAEKELNWEFESKKFLSKIETLLGKN